MKKRTIRFDLNIVNQNERIEIDGIRFSGIAFIIIFIDEQNLMNENVFNESFIFFDELKKSTQKSGKYLLFTSVSGIADDAGWQKVSVLHLDDLVIWEIELDNESLIFHFDKNEYIIEIQKLNEKIDSLDINLSLEPLYVLFPE